MAKVFKVSMYVTDYNDFYQDGEHLENDLELYDGSINCVEIEESEEFEWKDEIKINYLDATKEDFEAYFKKKD